MPIYREDERIVIAQALISIASRMRVRIFGTDGNWVASALLMRTKTGFDSLRSHHASHEPEARDGRGYASYANAHAGSNPDGSVREKTFREGQLGGDACL